MRAGRATGKQHAKDCGRVDLYTSSPILERAIRCALPARRLWRRTTSRLRALPDFVIVGAQKAGTSSLYDYLCAEPGVLRAAAKEVHFFDTCDWTRGRAAYRGNFPMRARMWLVARRNRQRVITGEATPYYLYHPLAARRLAATVPGVKVIILLRDPVERTLSHYWHEVRFQHERLPLRDALAAEPGRLAGHEDALLAGEPACRHRDYRNFSYVDRSRYTRQVARFLQEFGPDRVLVLRSEPLFADDPGSKRRLAEFLGLPPMTRPFLAANVGSHQDRDAEEASVRPALAELLAPDEEELARLLGEEFRWPRPAAGALTSGSSVSP